MGYAVASITTSVNSNSSSHVNVILPKPAANNTRNLNLAGVLSAAAQRIQNCKSTDFRVPWP
jgi:hypothetical protein